MSDDSQNGDQHSFRLVYDAIFVWCYWIVLCSMAIFGSSGILFQFLDSTACFSLNNVGPATSKLCSLFFLYFFPSFYQLQRWDSTFSSHFLGFILCQHQICIWEQFLPISYRWNKLSTLNPIKRVMGVSGDQIYKMWQHLSTADGQNMWNVFLLNFALAFQSYAFVCTEMENWIWTCKLTWLINWAKNTNMQNLNCMFYLLQKVRVFLSSICLKHFSVIIWRCGL